MLEVQEQGICFWKRLVLSKEETLERRTLGTMWTIWHVTNETEADNRVWIGKFFDMLTNIGWKTDRHRRELETIGKGITDNERNKQIEQTTTRIKQRMDKYGIKEMWRSLPLCRNMAYPMLKQINSDYE